ncbi:MAG TPA: hypothetical protein VGR15_09485 [Bacteroidota bacterium]|nr:hypothetical protein [Bacteroidota bacterium]
MIENVLQDIFGVGIRPDATSNEIEQAFALLPDRFLNCCRCFICSFTRIQTTDLYQLRRTTGRNILS